MDFDIITAGSLQYRVAGWPQRVVARGLDVALVILALAVPGEVFGMLKVPVGFVYLFLGSGLMKGASLGKRALGLKVIEARHGGPCSVMQDFLRQRYFLYGNPMMLVFMVYDSVTDRLYQPETCVVLTTPLTAAETEVPPEKPAKLDLAGMGETLRKMRAARDETGRSEGFPHIVRPAKHAVIDSGLALQKSTILVHQSSITHAENALVQIGLTIVEQSIFDCRSSKLQ